MDLLNDIIMSILASSSQALGRTSPRRHGRTRDQDRAAGTGDICRQLYVSDTRIEGESTIFHAINRNKQSYAAVSRTKMISEKIKKLITSADVVLHNFAPASWNASPRLRHR